MKMQKIENQLGRIFYAIYECEHCGHEKLWPGYDDDHFRRSIPRMRCPECGRRGEDD